MIYCKDCGRVYFHYKTTPKYIEVTLNPTGDWLTSSARASIYMYMCMVSEAHTIHYIKEFSELGAEASKLLHYMRKGQNSILLKELSPSDLLFVTQTLKLGELT